MKQDEPGVTFKSLLKMLRRVKIRPMVKESTCGHCKTTYNEHVGHMCAYVKELYSKLGES
ncbi:hypothetical protein SEA_TOMAS_132 [Streptomyces phage Tomas]|uniref:Uncharacterized protein n=1 Tax=Streptomyces phage Tomas TaxID=2914443 RepID=A0AA49H105_9CAUD|nr:hypothetical protein PP453_gp158 [Streptomyces phage Tomas]UMO76309.1 hypothetical protein SEA_TOMAS_132 [Streptomyces phage Tomas]